MTGPVIRLSFDATAVPSHPVGAGRYTIDLARALGKLGEVDVDMSIWCRTGDDIRLRDAIGGHAHAKMLAKAPKNRAARLAWEQVRLHRLIAEIGVDVHHAPHYTMPERSPVPVVVTIHDLTFIEHPEWHERSKVIVFRRAIKVAARRAAVLVCVSSTTADRLAELLKPRAPVVVAPHGVDTARFRPPTSADEDDDRQVLKKQGLQSPYILFVGTLEPRKAVPDLVTAFDRIASAAANRDLTLVIAGGAGWGAEDLNEAVARSPHGERIIRTGYVDDNTVAVLMRQAQVVAYPALEEGFGLPALEALATGTPLVTTSGTAMAEIAGGAATLVTPGDTHGLADAIEAALARGPEILSKIEAGRLVAASHTWEDSAKRHVEAYRLAEQISQ